MLVFLHPVKREEVSKFKDKFLCFFLLNNKTKLTFRTKFKNSECNIFGPIFCNSRSSVFNIGLLDSLNTVTVRERISQIFLKNKITIEKIKKSFHTSVTSISLAYCFRIIWRIGSRSRRIQHS
jgi:hypothetical protein